MSEKAVLATIFGLQLAPFVVFLLVFAFVAFFIIRLFGRVYDDGKKDDEDFKKSWSLENLQPLWAKDNQSKGNRRIG